MPPDSPHNISRLVCPRCVRRQRRCPAAAMPDQLYCYDWCRLIIHLDEKEVARNDYQLIS